MLISTDKTNTHRIKTTTTNTQPQASKDRETVLIDTAQPLTSNNLITHHLRRIAEVALVMKIKHLLEAKIMQILFIPMVLSLQLLHLLLISLKFSSQTRDSC